MQNQHGKRSIDNDANDIEELLLKTQVTEDFT